MNRLVAGIVGFVCGAVAGAAFCSLPVETQVLTFRAKEECLTKEGISLKVNYRGWGRAQFVILPPLPPEKKEVVK